MEMGGGVDWKAGRPWAHLRSARAATDKSRRKGPQGLGGVPPGMRFMTQKKLITEQLRSDIKNLNFNAGDPTPTHLMKALLEITKIKYN